jgi:hypothetical protein
MEPPSGITPVHLTPGASLPVPGYHLVPIAKGIFGEISKIEEELAELVDAQQQQIVIMELAELSDLYGAIEGYLERHHPSVTMSDLKKMSDATRRAFLCGRR